MQSAPMAKRIPAMDKGGIPSRANFMETIFPPQMILIKKAKIAVERPISLRNFFDPPSIKD